jgi:hypothetical protein
MPVGRDIGPARYRAAVGVDRTRLRQGGPVCPPSAGTGSAHSGRTIEFLRGDWDVERQITDRRSGQDGVFRGRARFLPSADGGGLEYTENGELHFGSHHGPASRSLSYLGRPDGAADVRFADGREFYRLDLQSGRCEADHPCRADQYHVTVTALGANAFSETWQVAGPGKDYELRTLYRRMTGAGSDGGFPAGGAALVGPVDGGTTAERSGVELLEGDAL